MTTTQDTNAKLIVGALNKYGLTNPFLQAGILATVYKESGFLPQSEVSYANTSNAQIRNTFGSRLANYSEDQLTALKKDSKAFFDAVYGNAGGNNGEGYKYRGRGFNQITFRNTYKEYGDKMGVDLEGNPDLLNKPEYAAEALALFFKDSLNSGVKLGTFKKFGVTSSDDIKTAEQGTQVAIQSNAGLGTSFNNSTVQQGYKKAMGVVSDYLTKYAGQVGTTIVSNKKTIIVVAVVTSVVLITGAAFLTYYLLKKQKVI